MHGLTDYFEHGALGGGHPLSAGGGTCVLSCSNSRKPVVFNISQALMDFKVWSPKSNNIILLLFCPKAKMFHL
jgi:hypothetical protein